MSSELSAFVSADGRSRIERSPARVQHEFSATVGPPTGVRGSRGRRRRVQAEFERDRRHRREVGDGIRSPATSVRLRQLERVAVGEAVDDQVAGDLGDRGEGRVVAVGDHEVGRAEQARAEVRRAGVVEPVALAARQLRADERRERARPRRGGQEPRTRPWARDRIRLPARPRACRRAPPRRRPTGGRLRARAVPATSTTSTPAAPWA